MPFSIPPIRIGRLPRFFSFVFESFFSRRNLYELHERAHNDDCPRRDRGINLARRVNIDDYRAATNCSLQFPQATELSLWGKGGR